jgi:hypothetical protein
VAVDQSGGTAEVLATFRGQLEIVRINGGQPIVGLCYTLRRLYSVYAVLGVCCPQCILHSVYASLSVYSQWWNGESERDDLTLCSCDDGRGVDKRESDGG